MPPRSLMIICLFLWKRFCGGNSYRLSMYKEHRVFIEIAFEGQFMNFTSVALCFAKWFCKENLFRDRTCWIVLSETLFLMALIYNISTLFWKVPVFLHKEAKISYSFCIAAAWIRNMFLIYLVALEIVTASHFETIEVF